MRIKDSSKRVVLVSGSYKPREGGAERQWRAVLESLAADGVQCAVVTQVLDGEPRMENLNGVEVYRVGSSFLFKAVPRLGMLSFLAAATVRAVGYRPSVVLSSMLGSASGAAAIAASLGRKSHVIRLTGGGTAAYRSEPLARASKWVSRLWCRAIASRRPTLVAPAEHLVRDYKVAFPHHRVETRVIPNGVSGAFRDRGVDRNGVGWYARSGSQSADDAFIRLALALPQLAFFTFGRVLADVPPNVCQCGWLDDPARFLSSIKVLVNTTPTEGMPNVVLQALASGTRVVGFENAGLAEVAKKYSPESSWVTLAEPGNVEALAASVRLSVDDSSPVAAIVPTVDEVVSEWKSLLLEDSQKIRCGRKQ